jgi:phosphoglycerate dehydrogenase-like enzyme
MTRIAVLATSARGAPVAHGGFAVLTHVEALLPDDDVVTVYADEDLATAANSEAAVGGLDGTRLTHLLRVSPSLRWYHTMSAGVDQLLTPETVSNPQLVITNGSGAYDQPVAEHVIALVLAIAKRLPIAWRDQSAHRWASDTTAIDVRGSTLLVIGMGHIGSEVARLATALGMRVAGIRHAAGTALSTSKAIAEAVAHADFVVVCVPLTPDTRNLIDAAIINRMRGSAWIINVSRGPVIEHDALFVACRDARIGGAAIDVWWEEPLPASSEWWDVPNVILTPHRANSSPTLYQRALELFLENLGRFKSGQSLVNVVDKRRGY